MLLGNICATLSSPSPSLSSSLFKNIGIFGKYSDKFTTLTWVRTISLRGIIYMSYTEVQMHYFPHKPDLLLFVNKSKDRRIKFRFGDLKKCHF